MWQGKYELTVNQWGVGHGGLHSQSVAFRAIDRSAAAQFTGDELTVRFIYDCGAGRGPTSNGNMDPAISRMLRDIPDGTQWDLLAISHFDRDHVNGLDLLATRLEDHGMSVERIWAPILSPLEKLYVIASEPDPSDSLIDWTIDPVAAASERFDGVTVVLIPPTEEPIPPIAAEPVINAEGGEDEAWVSTIVTDRRIAVHGKVGSGAEALWEIQPYVVDSTVHGAVAVETDLVALLGRPVDRLTIADVRKIVSDKNLLPKFHKAIWAHRPKGRVPRPSGARTPSNYSTLSLYSGPVSPYEWCRYRSGWQPVALNRFVVPVAPSWLGTGDAGLRGVQHVDALGRSLPGRLDRVGVASVPHHGAKDDSGAPLWDALPNTRIVRACQVVCVSGFGRGG